MRTFETTATILFLALAGPALAQHQHGSSAPAGTALEVQGEVVDLHCYRLSGARGPEHLECAQKCFAEGHPLGLVDSTGKLYQLEPGEQSSKTVKLANFGLHHGLMCVTMPLELVEIVTEIKTPDLSSLKFRGKSVELKPEWLAREVKVKGRLVGLGDAPLLAVDEAQVLGPAPAPATGAAPASEPSPQGGEMSHQGCGMHQEDAAGDTSPAPLPAEPDPQHQGH